MGYPTTQVHPLCASYVERTIIQRATARNRQFLTSIVRASNTCPAVVHLYPEPPQPQMVRLKTITAHQAPTCEAGEHIHQICPKNRKRRSQRTKTSRNMGIHNSLRPNRQTQVHAQHCPRLIEIHIHHLLVKISISTHHHWVDTCIHSHLLHHSSIYLNPIRSSYNRTLTLLLHLSR